MAVSSSKTRQQDAGMVPYTYVPPSSNGFLPLAVILAGAALVLAIGVAVDVTHLKPVADDTPDYSGAVARYVEPPGAGVLVTYDPLSNTVSLRLDRMQKKDVKLEIDGQEVDVEGLRSLMAHAAEVEQFYMMMQTLGVGAVESQDELHSPTGGQPESTSTPLSNGMGQLGGLDKSAALRLY